LEVCGERRRWWVSGSDSWRRIEDLLQAEREREKRVRERELSGVDWSSLDHM